MNGALFSCTIITIDIELTWRKIQMNCWLHFLLLLFAKERCLFYREKILTALFVRCLILIFQVLLYRLDAWSLQMQDVQWRRWNKGWNISLKCISKHLCVNKDDLAMACLLHSICMEIDEIFRALLWSKNKL